MGSRWLSTRLGRRSPEAARWLPGDAECSGGCVSSPTLHIYTAREALSQAGFILPSHRHLITAPTLQLELPRASFFAVEIGQKIQPRGSRMG